MKKTYLFLITSILLVLQTSCKKDDDSVVDEEPIENNCEMTIVSDWHGFFSGGCQGETVDVIVSESTNPENFKVEVIDVGDGSVEFEATIITEIGCRARILTYPFTNKEIILRNNKNQIAFDFLGSADGIPCSFLVVDRD